MKKTLFIVALIAVFSCNKKNEKFEASFTSVETDTLLNEQVSIRALTIDGSKAWYAGSGGRYGWVTINKGNDFIGIAAQDTLMPEFRSIAQTDTDIFILNAGSPALLYKISKDGKKNNLVYTETGEKVFYDSMQFRDNKNGIAIGDPTNGCLSVIVTNDGGETWNKPSCDVLPQTVEGEAAFAASNTNLVVKGDKTWIISGGKKSRVFYSPDRCRTWKVFDTPIVQGSEMTGMFSVDFYDDKTGFAVGGDYDRPTKNTGNKIITQNGGKTWKTVGEGTAFGYASCVQFVPGSNGKELLTAGPSGIYYSFDRGATWKQILESDLLHTVKFIDDKTAVAAGQNIILKLSFK